MDVWAADVYGTEERKPESLPAVLADKAAVELSTSGWMEPNSSLIRYTGGKTVKVPQNTFST